MSRVFRWIVSFLFDTKKQLTSFYCSCSARGRLMLCNRVLFRFKQNFQNFQHKWSYDKMIIDWVRSGRTEKYLLLGQKVRTSLGSVRTSWPRAKYFLVRPSHSVNKYILFTLRINTFYFDPYKFGQQPNEWKLISTVRCYCLIYLFRIFLHDNQSGTCKRISCLLILSGRTYHY